MTLLLLLGFLTFQTPMGECPSDELNALDAAVAELGTQLHDIGSASLRKRLVRRLNAIKRAAGLVRERTCSQVDAATTPAPQASTPQRSEPSQQTPLLAPILDTPSYRALVGALRSEQYADARLELLGAGLSGACITVAQAREVLRTFQSTESKLKAARRVLPRVVDRSKSAKLFGAFAHGADKRRLSQLLKATAVDVSCAVPTKSPSKANKGER